MKVYVDDPYQLVRVGLRESGSMVLSMSLPLMLRFQAISWLRRLTVTLQVASVVCACAALIFNEHCVEHPMKHCINR